MNAIFGSKTYINAPAGPGDWQRARVRVCVYLYVFACTVHVRVVCVCAFSALCKWPPPPFGQRIYRRPSVRHSATTAESPPLPRVAVCQRMPTGICRGDAANRAHLPLLMLLRYDADILLRVGRRGPGKEFVRVVVYRWRCRRSGSWSAHDDK